MAANGSPHNATDEVNESWIRSELALERAEDYPNQEYIVFLCDLLWVHTLNRC